MSGPGKIDLHMHTTVSDGTDTPGEIVQKVKNAGIGVFSVTDHDAIMSAQMIRPILKAGDPAFITGVEFSCKDNDGQYHVLGYGYDPEAAPIRGVVELGHSYRMNKVMARLSFIKDKFGIAFPDEEIDRLLALSNPGKPHIGNLMVKYGYAKTREEAINDYIDGIRFKDEYVRPEQAIGAILDSGGIPVLAHPTYGSGDQIVIGYEMDKRLRKLIGYGLMGVEAYYSGFTSKIRAEMLSFAEKYSLYVTAGSDYHGANKIVQLADTGLDAGEEIHEGLKRFLSDIGERIK